MGVISRAIKSMPFPGWGGYGGYGGWGGWSGAIGTRFPFFRGQPGERDWTKIIGDGSGNSLVEACVLWICRNFPQAPMMVVQEDTEGVMQKVKDHPLPKLWKRPNEYFSGTMLWYGVLTSWIVNGNAYILKERNDAGRVVKLWYIPHTMMIPRWNSPNRFIDWYDYIVNGERYPVAVQDVYHLRYGLDPDNIRMGRSPLRTLFRELGVDEEASRFSASLLYNLGVPGIVISPEKDSNFGKGSEWEEENKRLLIKAKFKSSFGGDNRGDPIVLSKPTNVVQFGFSPNDMDLSAIRDVPEERVTAVIGLPASVVGFQQQNSKVGATRAEERDQAFENCMNPAYSLVGAEMTVQMLPDFAKSPYELDHSEVTFDLSKAYVLLDAQNKVAEKWSTLARSDLVKRSEVRAALGFPVNKEEDDKYVPSPGVQEIRPDGTIILSSQRMNPALGGGQPQLALPSGKDIDDIERKVREDRRDQILIDGLKTIGAAVVEGMKEAAKANVVTVQAPPNNTVRVVRDESGRLVGIERSN